MKIIKIYFSTLDSLDGNHNLSIDPNNIVNIEIPDQHFDPKDYVVWDYIHWHSPRNWDKYS